MSAWTPYKQLARLSLSKETEPRDAKRAYHKVIRNVKDIFLEIRVEKASSVKDVFEMEKWHR